MLQLEIKRGDVPVSGEIDEYIRERAARLDAYYNSILTCRVILEAPISHHQKGGPYEVHIDLDVPGAVLAVNRQRAEELHVAIRDAFAAAQRQLEDYARRQRGQVKVLEGQPLGRVLRVFPEEGYGFIAAEDGHEVYFHRNSVLGAGFESLEPGSEVRYVEEPGDEGPQASTVTPAG